MAVVLLALAGAMPSQAADFKWQDRTGSVHSLHEYAGKPLILHLWASWCPPCREEIGILTDWMRAHPEVTMIPVSLDSSVADAEGFLTNRNIQLPVLLSDNQQAFGMGTRGLPSTFVIAADGSTRRIYLGAQHWDSQDFNRQLLGELQP